MPILDFPGARPWVPPGQALAPRRPVLIVDDAEEAEATHETPFADVLTSLRSRERLLAGKTFLHGYAALTGVTSTHQHPDGTAEMWLPRAFVGIDDTYCMATIDHDQKQIFASVDKGNLLVAEDGLGLWFRATLTEPWLGTIRAAFERGRIRGASFCLKESWATHRVVGGKRVYSALTRLHDVSIMIDTGPFFEQTKQYLRLGQW
jgi:phage head maturation protease